MKPREPLQCWGCGEVNQFKECPHRRENLKGIHNLEEFIAMEGMA